MIGFAVVGVAYSHSHSIELSSDGKLTESKGKVTSSPTSTPEILPLPQDARALPVSEGVLLGGAIQKVQPTYPLEAQANGITGEVKIRVTFDQEGYLREVVPLDGHPLLQAAALSAVKQWRWRPTPYDGPPIFVTGTLTFYFPTRA